MTQRDPGSFRDPAAVIARNPRVLPLLVTAALALLLFFVLPASMYLGNLSEFGTPPAPIARLLLIPVLLCMVAAIVGLRLSRREDFSRFSSIVAALTLLVWVQAYLLVWDYGLLDGSPIDWSAHAWRFADLLPWIAGLPAAAIFHRRAGATLATAAIALVALQGAALAASAIAQRDTLALKYGQRVAAGSLDAMARFSPARNVLHIVLDSFQADVFKDLITAPAGPQLTAALTGFTFYEEHLGTFPATYLALPALVSGQAYRNQVPQAQFMDEVFGGKTVLNAAHDAGFEVDLATEPMMLGLLMKGDFDNAWLTSHPPLVEEAARVLDLALFRVAPHVLKPLVYNEQRWLIQGAITTSPLMWFPYFTHNAFLAHVTRHLATDRAKPVYKFFHLMTTHAPFVVNPDCSYAGELLDRVREPVTAQSECSLGFVVALLNRMKQAGIYDSSLIVIMGDHGGHIPPHRYRAGSFTQDHYRYDVSPQLVGLATPLLALKPPGAAHPFRVSTALTSSIDIAATIDALLGLGAGLPGRSLLDETRGAAEERRFFGYDWNKEDAVSDYIGGVHEYRITGSAYRIESWHLAANHPAPTQRPAP